MKAAAAAATERENKNDGKVESLIQRSGTKTINKVKLKVMNDIQ